jgi:hypothetical protein
MSGPTVYAAVVPTGGAISLSMPAYKNAFPALNATMTIARATVPVAPASIQWTTIYQGVPTPLFVDPGEVSNDALSGAQQYIYQVTDATGTTTTPPLSPTSSLTMYADGMTNLFIRLLRGAVKNMVLPPGIPASEVYNAMPVRGAGPLPFIFVNLDLVQQRYEGLGRSVQNPNNENEDIQPVYARWTWRVSVFGADAKSRDFYRDAVIAIWNSLQKTVFTNMGNAMEYSFQAASYQLSEEMRGLAPSMFGADVLCMMTGQFNAVLLTAYDFIETVQLTAMYGGGAEDIVSAGSA